MEGKILRVEAQKTHKNTQIHKAYVRQGLQGAEKKRGRGEKIGQDVPNVSDLTLTVR